jgi:hypothetical protein
MTLNQQAQVKHWLVLHRRNHPVEYQAWDMILMCWVLGLMGVPGLLLTDTLGWLPICLLGFLLPSLYAELRIHLHRRGRLRCDWLTAL